MAGRFGIWSSSLRRWFIGGTLLSCLGFALPWFRISRRYEWWYGGWHLLTTNEPDLWWIGFFFVGYFALLLAGYWLPRLASRTAGLLALLVVVLVLGTLIVVALAAADAVQDQGRVYRLDLNLGLFLKLSGHGLMIVSGLGSFVVQLVKEILPGTQATAAGATQDASSS